jgi:hypothetical protein
MGLNNREHPYLWWKKDFHVTWMLPNSLAGTKYQFNSILVNSSISRSVVTEKDFLGFFLFIYLFYLFDYYPNQEWYVLNDYRCRSKPSTVKLPKAERRHVEGGRQFLQPYPHPTVFFFYFLYALYSCVKRSVCRLHCMTPSWIWIDDPRYWRVDVQVGERETTKWMYRKHVHPIRYRRD